jgi:beta-glucanase (GH16 family)
LISKKIMISLCWAAILLWFSAYTAQAEDAPDVSAAGPGWVITFEDEFNTLDTTNVWDIVTDNPSGLLSARTPNNVSAVNGKLVLETRKDYPAGTNKTWSTGYVKTKANHFTQKYGYFEARIKIAGTTGQNNAFWMTNPASTGNQIEIDITEGKYPNKSNMALHNWSAIPKWAEGLQRTENDLDLSTSFHTYGLLWTEDKLTWYLDGDRVYELPHQVANVSTDLKFSTAVVDWPSAGPVTDALNGETMEIDYVRVYKYAGTAAEVVVDNGGTGYMESGSWSPSTLLGYIGSSTRYSTQTSAPAAYAQWQPTLTEGMYRVAIYKVVNPTDPLSGDNAALITIHSNDGSKTFSVDYTSGTSGWYDLGIYSFRSGTHGYVRNTIQGGIARADAVRFLKLNSTIIVDNASSGFNTTGSWTASNAYSPTWSSKGFYGIDYLTDNSSIADSDKSATWTPSITRAGLYKIYLRWTASSNRPNAAPLEIKHKYGTDLSKTVNQQLNNDSWVEIGTYTFDPADTNSVTIKASEAGFTIADASKFVYIGVN